MLRRSSTRGPSFRFLTPRCPPWTPSTLYQNPSTALEAAQDESALAPLHGEYHQDKRALRGARASSSGGRDDSWQAEAEAELDDGCSSGGAAAITLSSLPRGYWATLFNLEVVKARNRPKEPPKKPEAAPFFLATVHKGGDAAPSFADFGDAAGTAAAAALMNPGGKGKARVSAASDAPQSDAPQLPDMGVEDVPDLPSAGDGDAWSEDDDDAADDDEDGEGRKEVAGSGNEETVAVGGKRGLGRMEGAGAHGGFTAPKSKILKQMKFSARLGGKGPSRCKLADLLLECEGAARMNQDEDDEMNDEEEEEWGEEGGRKKPKFDAVLRYLKALAPPMVDVDMSLLCQGDWDEEGVHLVGLAVQFLLEELR